MRALHPVRVGQCLLDGKHIYIQSMLNTRSDDIAGSVAQAKALEAAGCEIVRAAIPNMDAVALIPAIKEAVSIPLVADIHFDYKLALAAADAGVDKIRINPGNIGSMDRVKAVADKCREKGIPIRIGVNSGSLEKDLLAKYGGPTPEAMVESALHHAELLEQNDFNDIVISIKSSDVQNMIACYRLAAERCQYPLHLGVTEAGGGDSGRIKSCVGISALLREGIGDTIRVSLTEPPVNELPVAMFLAGTGGAAPLPEDQRRMLEAASHWGPMLLDREIDEIPDDTLGEYLKDEIMQAARRRFYKPEYIACPGCGRTMYNLQETFEEVQRRTAHLKGMVIAVMGCIVNGPGEMADADWGYVGEGGGKVSIYRKGQPVLRHVPDTEAIDKLLELIEAEGA